MRDRLVTGFAEVAYKGFEFYADVAEAKPCGSSGAAIGTHAVRLQLPHFLQ